MFWACVPPVPVAGGVTQKRCENKAKVGRSFATLWPESGENPKVLQEILGHSRIDVSSRRCGCSR